LYKKCAFRLQYLNLWIFSSKYALYLCYDLLRFLVHVFFLWYYKFPLKFTTVQPSIVPCGGGVSKNYTSYFAAPFKNIKVENILKGSLDSIPSPSPSVKNQIMGTQGKFPWGVKTKHCWVLKTKSLLTSPSNVLPYYLK
jgi:hypothetical protein